MPVRDSSLQTAYMERETQYVCSVVKTIKSSS